jgi:hypothetical protein
MQQAAYSFAGIERDEPVSAAIDGGVLLGP